MEAVIANRAPGGEIRSARIRVSAGDAPGDWHVIYNRLDASGGSAMLFLGFAAALAALAGLLGSVSLLAPLLWRVFPEISTHCMALFVVPPGFLAAAAAGQAGGNLFLRLRYRLDGATRRGFASRLTLGRTPAAWPEALRRWLFTGDWLGTPERDVSIPYLRIFVVGDAPETCCEEDAIWREIHRGISDGDRREAGANHREISYPSELPAWVRDVEDGEGMAKLQQRIGEQAAGDWVAHLWRSALRQCPTLGGGVRPEAANLGGGFELHSLRLTRGREALAVVLRPSPIAGEAPIL